MTDVNSAISAILKEHDLPPKESGPIRQVVSSGVLGLDLATDVPGIPRGTMIDLFGDEGLGKTTLSLTMAAERVKNGERVVYLDIEHRVNDELIDTIIGQRMPPDANGKPIRAWYPDDDGNPLFRVSDPSTGDDALTALRELVALVDDKTGKPAIQMVIVDSVAALMSKNSLENPDKTYIGGVAQMMSNVLARLAILVYQNDTIILFINQVRMRPMTFGPVMSAPTGGRAIKFYTSLRMNMMGKSEIRQQDKKVGQVVDVVFVKNSYRGQGGKTSISIIFGEGIDKYRDLIDWGIDLNIIQQKSSWLYYKDIKANGEAALIQELYGKEQTLIDEIVAAYQAKKDLVKAAREEKKSAKIAANSKPEAGN